MLMKLNARGTGPGSGPVGYLLSDRDHTGEERSVSPQILRGDPAVTEALIDSLGFVHRYSSGCWAFAAEDAPTPEQMRAVMDETERHAFPGLDADRISWLWVLHQDKGRVELNFVVARVDLATGKAINGWPPGWEAYWNPLRDRFNLTHGWADPDDPARARGPADHPELPDWRTAKREAAAVITEHLLGEVAAGRIDSRAQLIEVLRNGFGLEITRESTAFIGTRDPQTNRRTRLRGDLYDAGFFPAGAEAFRTAAGVGAGGDRAAEQRRRERLAAAGNDVDRGRESRQRELHKRYCQRPEGGEGGRRNAARFAENAAVAGLDDVAAALDRAGALELRRRAVVAVDLRQVGRSGTPADRARPVDPGAAVDQAGRADLVRRAPDGRLLPPATSTTTEAVSDDGNRAAVVQGDPGNGGRGAADLEGAGAAYGAARSDLAAIRLAGFVAGFVRAAREAVAMVRSAGLRQKRLGGIATGAGETLVRDVRPRWGDGIGRQPHFLLRGRASALGHGPARDAVRGPDLLHDGGAPTRLAERAADEGMTFG